MWVSTFHVRGKLLSTSQRKYINLWRYFSEYRGLGKIEKMDLARKRNFSCIFTSIKVHQVYIIWQQIPFSEAEFFEALKKMSIYLYWKIPLWNFNIRINNCLLVIVYFYSVYYCPKKLNMYNYFVILKVYFFSIELLGLFTLPRKGVLPWK